METNLSLVADFGRTFSRIGYSGDDWPRLNMESYLAYTIENQSVNGEWDQTLGQPLPTKMKILSGDKLHNFNPGFTYEPLWKDGSLAKNPKLGDFFTSDILPSLNLEGKPMPLLMSEHNFITKEERKSLLATFLESNIASHFLLMRQSLLSLYACGKINGAVIDSSSQFTTISTIEEGYFVPEGFVKLNFGGETITEKIAEKFSSSDTFILPESLRKENADLTLLDDSFFEFEKRSLARKIKHEMIGQSGNAI